MDDASHIFDSSSEIWDLSFSEGIDPILANETRIRMQDLGNGQQQLSIIPTTPNAREVLQRRFDALQLVRRTMEQARLRANTALLMFVALTIRAATALPQANH